MAENMERGARRGLKADPKDRPKAAKSKRQLRLWPRGLTGKALQWAAVAAIWGGVALGLVLAYFAYDLPPVSGLHDIDRRPSVTLLSRDGALIATYGDLYGEHLTAAQIPLTVRQALIATEDRRFYHHFGLDVIGLARAIYVNMTSGRLVQGGSTITQQLAKNVYLSGDRTLKRKVQELLLSLWLEHKFTKDEILELYLNRVYFGAGAYGVEAAAQRYFAKPAKQLDLTESAMLVGLLRAPSKLSPTANLTAAQNRAATVIANMAAADFITADEARAAQAQPARLAAGREPARGARYFADYLLDELNDLLGRSTDDLVVQTTLDLGQQQAAEKAVADVLDRDGPKSDASQAALVAMSPDGAIRALVGGRDWRESPFNRATQARREPGSAFKLFVFLAALEAGYRPDSTFVDGPISVGHWRPRNYEGGYLGEVTFRTAAARSINTVAVQLTEKVGRGRVIDMARRLGLSNDMMAVPSIALGAMGVSLVELTGAYDMVGNGGMAIEPYGIVTIKDRRGNLVYKRAAPRTLRVLDTAIVGEANALLTGVIEGGTGKAARLGRPAAGKTGTSSDFRDAMFMGYTAELTAGVWVGNDDASPMHKVTGGGLPAQIWKQFMTTVLKDQPARPLLVAAQRPPGLFDAVSAATAAQPPRSIVPPTLQPTTPNDPARWNPAAANR